MDYSKIVFVKEFASDDANEKANEYLEQGRQLVSVGTKLTDIIESGQAYYTTYYVVGATQEQYNDYLHALENAEDEREKFKF